MPIVRTILERLLLAVFAITRIALLAQGLAMLAAVMVVSLVSQPDWPPWAARALRSSHLVSATLLVAGVLLMAARRLLPARATGDAPAEWLWPALLALALVSLPMLAWLRVSELVALWPEISAMLDQAGFWDAVRKNDPIGGVLLLPIMIALFVPALETAAAFFLIAVPPVLIALLALRSSLFQRSFAMLVICQAGFVIASLLAADAFSVLATALESAMKAERDLEVRDAAAVLLRLREVLVSTSHALVVPALGYLAWLPFVVRSGWAAAYFRDGASGTNEWAQGGSGRGPVSAG